MSQSQTSSQPDIDKKALYGRYQDAEDRRAKLALKMQHKALDIPEEDDVNINVDKSTRSGLGWKEMLVIVLGLLGTGGLGIGAYKAFNPPAQSAPTEQAPSQPADHRDNIGLFEMDISGG
jgi:hypothetical protein